MQWGPGCGRSLHGGKQSEQPGRGAAVPLCEGSQHYMQQVLVEGLERDLRLFREISAQAGLGASASVLGLVMEFEAKTRAAKGEVQSEMEAKAQAREQANQDAARKASQPR